MKKPRVNLMNTIERHKRKHGYAQYNRLAKREWFPILDVLLRKLKTESKESVIKELIAELENYKG